MIAALEAALRVIDVVDPDNDGRVPAVQADLLGADWDRQRLMDARSILAQQLADPDVSTADLKGALNRSASSAWGISYERKYSAREFVEALVVAIDAYLAQR